MMLELETRSRQETADLGAALAEVLSAGTTILLIGGLGAGKTALSQGIARGLGVTARVTSPTFTMVSTYAVDGRRGILTLLHADLYRVGSGVEADDLALAELVEEGAVALVEWGDVAPDVLGGDQVVVTIEVGASDTDRLVRLDDLDGALDAARLEAALQRWLRS
jgi:tRNA threonylcarbamoyladenosine biosynthesis protein TsaE